MAGHKQSLLPDGINNLNYPSLYMGGNKKVVDDLRPPLFLSLVLQYNFMVRSPMRAPDLAMTVPVR